MNQELKDLEKQCSDLNHGSLGFCPLIRGECEPRCLFRQKACVAREGEAGETFYYVKKPECALKVLVEEIGESLTTTAGDTV